MKLTLFLSSATCNVCDQLHGLRFASVSVIFHACRNRIDSRPTDSWNSEQILLELGLSPNSITPILTETMPRGVVDTSHESRGHKPS